MFKRIFDFCKSKETPRPYYLDWTFMQVMDHARVMDRLPYEFDFWDMKDCHRRPGSRLLDGVGSSFAGKTKKPFTTISHEAAREGWLPSHFNQWALEDSEGKTVAHALVWGLRHGRARLPENLSMDFWCLTGRCGVPVIHYALEVGCVFDDLPRSAWSIRDAQGRPAAHVAASKNTLPSHFFDWDLRDARMNTVAHVLALSGGDLEAFDAWSFQDEEGQTWPGWMMRNDFGDTVAHLAAKKGVLPEAFCRHDLWEMLDQRGQRVIDVAIRRGHFHLVEMHKRSAEKKVP